MAATNSPVKWKQPVAPAPRPTPAPAEPAPAAAPPAAGIPPAAPVQPMQSPLAAPTAAMPAAPAASAPTSAETPVAPAVPAAAPANETAAAPATGTVPAASPFPAKPMLSPFNRNRYPKAAPFIAPPVRRVITEPSLNDILSPQSGQQFKEGVAREWGNAKEGVKAGVSELADAGKDIGQGAKWAAGKVVGAAGSAANKVANVVRNFLGAPDPTAAQPEFGGPNDQAPAKGKLVNWTAGGKDVTPKDFDETEAFIRSQYGDGGKAAVADALKQYEASDVPDKAYMTYVLSRLETRLSKPAKEPGAPLSPERMTEIHQESAANVRETFGDEAEAKIEESLKAIPDDAPNAEGRRAYLTGVLENLKHEKAGVSVDTHPVETETNDIARAREHMADGGTVSLRTGNGPVPISRIDRDGRPVDDQGRRYALGANAKLLLGEIPEGDREEAADTDTEPKTEVEKPADKAATPTKPIFIDVRHVIEEHDGDSNIAVDKIKEQIKANQEAGGSTSIWMDGKEVPVTMDEKGIVRDPNGNTAGLLSVAMGLPGKKSGIELKPAEGGTPQEPEPAKLPKTDTPEFKNWFGQSKAVDDGGKPLTLYHGTDADFTTFSKTQDLGYHFGTQEQANERLKDGDESQGKVIPAYLSIKNPLAVKEGINENHQFDSATGTYEMLKQAGFNPPELQNALDEFNKTKEYRRNGGQDALGKAEKRFYRAIKTSLIQSGYDGIKYENGIEGPGTSWIAFKPEQIKSAIGNNGDYDPKNPDIQKIFGFGRRQPPPSPMGPANPPEKFNPDKYAGRPFNPKENVADPSGMSKHHAKVVGVMNKGLDKLLPEVAQRFKNDNHAILARTTPEAAEHMARGLRTVEHFATAQALHDKMMTFPSIANSIKPEEMAGGGYVGPDSKIYVDGDVVDKNGDDKNGLHAQQIKGHELGHAIAEGIRRKESPNTWRIGGHVPEGWEQVHDLEMMPTAEHPNGKLTRYATTDPAESFAEACSSLLSGQLSPADFRREFPKGARVMERYGIMRKEAGHVEMQDAGAITDSEYRSRRAKQRREGAGPMTSPLSKTPEVDAGKPLVSPLNQPQLRSVTREGDMMPTAPEDMDQLVKVPEKEEKPSSKSNAPFDYSKADVPSYADKLTKDMGRAKAVEFVREHGLRIKYGQQYGIDKQDPAQAEAEQGFYGKTLHHLLGLHEPAAMGSEFHPIHPKEVATIGEQYYDPKSPAHRFLKETPDEHLAALASGTHGGKLTKSYRPSGWGSLSTEGNGVSGYRALEPDEPTTWQALTGKGATGMKIDNRNFDIDDSSPLKGHGYKVFANQVAAARAAGIKRFETIAAGPGFDAKDNGHYTWPRFGYEGEAHPNQLRNLPEDIRAKMGSSRSLRKLFDEVPGGKEAWQKLKIGTVPMHFDTDLNSINSKVLEKYAKQRDEEGKK